MMTTNNKKQFLDPIGTCCRLILLNFSPMGTKIRVIHHKIELTNDVPWETMVVRPWFRDSRNDLCVLFPAIVRFIEGYLCDTVDNKPRDRDRDEPIDKTTKNSEAQNSQHNKTPKTGGKEGGDGFNHTKCVSALRVIAKYVKQGLLRLGETYGYDNSTFALQYYASLLDEGISGKYTPDLLPVHLKNMTTNTLLNESSIKKLWSNKELEFICNTFTVWFDSVQSNNGILSNVHRASINELLNAKDVIFLNHVTISTES